MNCLAGGGEMGARMRSFDWSPTKLGAVAAWPQSLRTAVSIMLDSAFGMVVAWGPEFIFLYNDRYRPVLGATKHPSALGRPTRDVFPEVWDFIGPLFEKTRHGEAVALDDVLLPLDRNGYLEECYFTLSYSPIRDESGGVGGMLAVVAETTERVIGERRLATLRELAVLAEARTVDQACANAEVVLSTKAADVPFSLLYVLEADSRSARLAGVTGLSRGARAAPALMTLGDDDPWRLGECTSKRETVVLTDLPERFGPLPGGSAEEPTHTALVLPMLRVGHDRPHGFFIAGVSPRRALDDRYRTFFELGRDHIVAAIGNALAYEEERKRAEALAEIDRAKTAFFSNVSHEFRTPLTLMIGPTEDALASKEQALTGESLTTVHRNELRLLKLVNTLLDFSRIEAGRGQARYEQTDLAALTNDLASAFRSAIERAGLRYEVDCGPIRDAIYVDREMWEKIVLNLVSNAFKFTFTGTIRVCLRQEGDRVELSVEDTGCGMPEHELPRVFERFHRIEGTRSRTHEGSGIGLALVHDLVKLHGGGIRVTSEVDRGTTFTVFIPIGSSHLPGDNLGRARELASTAAARTEAFVAEALRWLPESEVRPTVVNQPLGASPCGHVLVVDDNADMRDYLVRLLRERWTVSTACDGQAALDIARSERPDVVLTDVMMPGLDGFGLLRALRADDRTKLVPVIMLSARAGEESRVDGLQAGANDYLVKPFSARELMARVSTQLDLSRLRREAELERSRLYALFEQAPAVIAILTGPEHVYRMANPSYMRVIGNRDVVGKPIREALPELRGQGIYELLDQAYETGEAAIGSEVFVKLQREGGLDDTHWNFVYQPFRGVQGQVEGIMIFAFDVTVQVLARQRAEALARKLRESEERLLESEQHLRTLADMLPILAWHATPNGEPSWFNRRWYEYTGTTPHTKQGWKWESVVDPRDLSRVMAKWNAALESGEPWEDHFRLRRNDGEYRWFLSRALPLRDSKGEIVRWFGTNVDVHERNEASRATDERLKLLIDSIKDYAVFMLDGEGRVISWNPGAERIKQYRAEEIVGQHFSRFYPEEDVRAGKCEHELRVATETGRFEDEGWRVRKDGTLFWANVIISTVRNDNGQLIGFSKVTRDLTERKRNEDERTARLAAERANRAKDEFLAMLGHELRNPLSPITTALHLMRLRGETSASREQEIIERQVKHLTRLVDDLLDVSRVARGKVELTKKDVRLADIVARAIEMASPLLEQRRHNLDVQVPRDGLVVHADETRMAQVVANLLTNAVKYTEPGGDISISAARDSDGVVLRVRDSGIGITADLLPHVFDLFVQGEQTAERSLGGLGLGLALVRSLVQLHGGTVRAESAGSGKGSEFVVRLPALAIEPPVQEPPRERMSMAATNTARRILVVDDNEDAAELLSELLRDLGHQVATAFDAAQALHTASQFQPQIAVLDIGLPVMDGYELASRLRERSGTGGEPLHLIALTGYGQEQDRERARRAGFDQHLVKPVDPGMLISTIEAIETAEPGEPKGRKS